MASPNRHWPSMFRSNLACNIQQQQHPDMNGNGSSSFLLSPPPASSGKPSLISSGCEEGTRNPEAKPRWNPRPEQIRILEGIFNSGMVNPPRDEIRRIRLQLQEYGHVGDANVFYWFQNRKSRTKNKLRAAAAAGHLHAGGRRSVAATPPPPPVTPPVTPPRNLLAAAVAAPTSSSSSSSDRSSGSSNKSVLKPAAAAAAAQLYYHHSHPTPTPMALDQLITSPDWPAAAASQYMPAAELGGVLGSHMINTPAAGVLLGLGHQIQQQEIIDNHGDMISSTTKEGLFGNYAEIINKNDDAVSAVIREDETARLGLLHYGVVTAANPLPRHHHHHHHQQQQQLASPVHAAVEASSTAMLPFTTAAVTTTTTNSAIADQLQGAGLLDAGLLQGGVGAATPLPSATVVALSRDAVTMCVKTTSYSFPAMMHLSVKMFGESAVLVRNTGETVLVDDSGVTVEPLQHGAFYYVLATEDAVQWIN